MTNQFPHLNISPDTYTTTTKKDMKTKEKRNKHHLRKKRKDSNKTKSRNRKENPIKIQGHFDQNPINIKTIIIYNW